MAKLTNYFSHDVSALSDPKIMIMISLHGMVSYAWWWILIERLAVEEDCKLPYNKFTFAGLAVTFQISDNLEFWKQNEANASSNEANEAKGKKGNKDIIFYSTDEHDEVKQNEANASNDIDINDLFEKSDTKLNDTQSKVYKVYMSEIGEISSVTKERIDDLVVDFGANEVVNAISIASERGKGSIGYITAILNNKVKEEVIKGNGSNGRSSGNRKNKAATDSSEVDWDKETGEWI